MREIEWRCLVLQFEKVEETVNYNVMKNDWPLYYSIVFLDNL